MSFTQHPEIQAAQVLNAAIMQHVQRTCAEGRPYCTSAELFERFGPDSATPQDRMRFHQKLRYLSFKGVLDNVAPNGKPAHWVCGTRATTRPVQPGQRAQPVPPKWVGPIVPPRRVDVMNGPVYVSTHAASTRAGADDFRHCRSVGVRC